MSILSKIMRRAQPASEDVSPSQPAVAPAPLEQTAASVKGTAALMIACPSPTGEDKARDAHRLRGQFLARQDRWDELSAEISAADRELTATPGAMPVVDLLCYGARSDVVAAAEHALIDGRPSRDAPLLQGIEALEEMLAEAPDDPVRAITVAQAHIDIGWAWRGTNWQDQVPQQNLDAFEAHFDRARDILEPFEATCAASALYCTARTALNARGTTPGKRVAREYEQLIDLKEQKAVSGIRDFLEQEECELHNGRGKHEDHQGEHNKHEPALERVYKMEGRINHACTVEYFAQCCKAICFPRPR